MPLQFASSGSSPLAGLPPADGGNSTLKPGPTAPQGTGTAAAEPPAVGLLGTQPRKAKVPPLLGRPAEQPKLSNSAAALGGTRPAGIPLEVKVSVGAFANPAGVGTSGAVQVTAKLGPTSLVGEFKQTYIDPIGKGSSTLQSRLRVGANRTVLETKNDKLVLGARFTTSYKSNLRDGSSSFSYGAGVTAGYTHKFTPRFNAVFSATLDGTVTDPSRGPSTSNLKAEGKGGMAYSLDKRGNNVVTGVVSGFTQFNSNGTKSDALAIGVEFLHKVGKDINLKVSAHHTLEGSGGGVDETYAPLAGGDVVKGEVSIQF